MGGGGARASLGPGLGVLSPLQTCDLYRTFHYRHPCRVFAPMYFNSITGCSEMALRSNFARFILSLRDFREQLVAVNCERWKGSGLAPNDHRWFGVHFLALSLPWVR